MGVVVHENPANKSMHNPSYTVGIIPVPDSHYSPVLYSHYQATKDYNTINTDIFRSSSAIKPADRKKTPKSVIVVSIIAGIVCCIKLVGKLIKK